MKGFRLPEHDPAATRQQLHALLRLAPDLAPDFSELLRLRCPGLVLNYQPDLEMLLLIYPLGGDCQAFLLQLSELIEVFAEAAGGGKPELLETRLVGALDGPPPPPFSRHIRLLDQGGVAPPGELGLQLEYGTSFGSGQHPSTRLAMQGLDRLFEQDKPFPGRVLDVGCGSGILALACGLMGAREVLGVDIDHAALDLAVENAQGNGLRHRVCFSDQPVAGLTTPYDLVVANLSGAVLGGMLADLGRLVRRPGGWLIISGLQGRQLAEVCGALGDVGFEVKEDYREGNWRAASLAAAALRP